MLNRYNINVELDEADKNILQIMFPDLLNIPEFDKCKHAYWFSLMKNNQIPVYTEIILT